MYMKDILINGAFTDSINVHDRGLHYGDGVFETMSVENGKVCFWNEHWRRLAVGCDRLAITLPEKKLIESEIELLCIKESQIVIKLIVTRGISQRGYRYQDNQQTTHVLLRYPRTYYPVEYATRGVAVRYCETILSENKTLAGIKHLNRLEQVLARNEWDTDKYQEGLMLTAGGKVVDGTMSNIFAVKDNSIITPELTLCGVAGIMRNAVIKLAGALEYKVFIQEFVQSELECMDEVFLTNSLIGIWPVRQIDKKEFSVGKITKHLQTELLERTGVK